MIFIIAPIEYLKFCKCWNFSNFDAIKRLIFFLSIVLFMKQHRSKHLYVIVDSNALHIKGGIKSLTSLECTFWGISCNEALSSYQAKP